ncbi:MAG: hypothetical protein HYZ53_30660 [Planctomycetes bacterium]|nr:hypothetical protein [Planctomycetota bacterium]
METRTLVLSVLAGIGVMAYGAEGMLHGPDPRIGAAILIFGALAPSWTLLAVHFGQRLLRGLWHFLRQSWASAWNGGYAVSFAVLAGVLILIARCFPGPAPEVSAGLLLLTVLLVLSVFFAEILHILWERVLDYGRAPEGEVVGYVAAWLTGLSATTLAAVGIFL